MRQATGVLILIGFKSKSNGYDSWPTSRNTPKTAKTHTFKLYRFITNRSESFKLRITNKI